MSSTSERGPGERDTLPLIECAWCSTLVAPLGHNISGGGYTFPRDEQGDVSCADCLKLPSYFVPTGHC